jgi:Patatin-like phospholipase
MTAEALSPTPPVPRSANPPKTAFVFAGGGSFGSVQVGMLRALLSHGVTADMVVGSSVGAMNAAYFAGMPTAEGVERLAGIWRSLRRQDVFPITWQTVLGFIRRRDFLVAADGVRRLIDIHVPYRNLEDAKLPLHVVATDLLSGEIVVLSKGPVAQAVVFVVPPLCPLRGSPCDFSRTNELIERAAESTRTWLAEGGLTRCCEIPQQMRAHKHH